jgi:RNA polymerase sigma factor (sigma-70 family)
VNLRPFAQSTDADELTASIEDPSRFSEIVRRHFAEIFRYLSRRAGSDAEDLAAETFVIAFRRRSTYDLERSDARPWLYGIATNVLRHHRRSEMRQLTAYAKSQRLVGHLTDVPGIEETVVEGLDNSISVARLASAFALLDDDHRDVLYLVGVAGLDYQQAADALGLRLGTLKSRVARARSSLRDLLEDDKKSTNNRMTIARGRPKR